MSRVQAGTVLASSGVTTQTVTLTGVTAGNLLELRVHWDMNAASGKPTLDSTAVTAGWLEAATAGPQVASANSGWITGVTAFYLQNSPSGSNSCKINFANSSRANSQIVEYSGYATSGAKDQSATNVTASATTLTATTSTTTQATELVTASIAARFVAGNSNITLTAPPSGYTQNGVLQDTNTYAGFESCYKEVTSTGTQAATWTWAGAGEAAALVVTYGTSAGTPATLSSPTSSSVSSATASVGATTNQGSGIGYAVVTTASLAGVTAAQVKAGQNASGSTSGVSSANVTISAASAFLIGITGLTQQTAYNYAVVQNNANGDTNVVTGSFTTTATPPTISSLSSSTANYQGTLTLTVTNAGASQSTGSVNIGGVAQSVTSWSNTSITITVVRGTLLYGAQTITVTNAGGGTSTGFALTFAPQTGWQYITAGTPNSTAAYRLTATGGGDIASGDQIAWGNILGIGTVVVNSDSTWVADPFVTSFDFEVGSSSGPGYGSSGLQNLNLAAVSTNVTIVAWF